MNATIIDHISTNNTLEIYIKTRILKCHMSEHFPVFIISKTIRDYITLYRDSEKRYKTHKTLFGTLKKKSKKSYYSNLIDKYKNNIKFTTKAYFCYRHTLF